MGQSVVAVKKKCSGSSGREANFYWRRRDCRGYLLILQRLSAALPGGVLCHKVRIRIYCHIKYIIHADECREV